MWLSEGGALGTSAGTLTPKPLWSRPWAGPQAWAEGVHPQTRWWLFTQEGTHSFGQRVCSRSVLFFVFFIQCNGFEVHLSY